MTLAYYSVYVALQKLGLKNLEGYYVEFYECPSESPFVGEEKPSDLVSKARNWHAVFLQAFRPASFEFLDIALHEREQHLGCYEEVLVFVGRRYFPWQCRTGSVARDPMLDGFARVISESLGFTGPPTLPREDHIVYVKRQSLCKNVVNTNQVEAAFPVPHRVFEMVDASQTYRETLTGLIRALRNSSIVFGPHGSGLTNMIFAAPGAVVIEVNNCYWREPLYRNIAVLAGKHYLELVRSVLSIL